MKRSRTGPDFELIVGGPQESFRWNTHGYPLDLAKWHYHPEYELHLIQHTTGKMFIGDHVGSFAPGSLVLTGPNLPHNWVSDIAPGEYVRNRDMLVQFKDSFVRDAMAMWPEIKEIEPLLRDARYGIEFHGDAALVGANVLRQIGQVTAMRRLLLLFELLYELAISPERRLLSSRDYSDAPDSAAADTIKQVIGFLMKNIAKDVHLSDAARWFGMSEPAFSRFFKRNTGHGFVHYLNRMRVNRACDLLTGDRKAGHRRVLRDRLQQPVQLQPPIPQAVRPAAVGISPARQAQHAEVDGALPLRRGDARRARARPGFPRGFRRERRALRQHH